MSEDASGITGTETIALAGGGISLNRRAPKHYGLLRAPDVVEMHVKKG